LERAKKGAKKSGLDVTKRDVLAIYIVEGLKSFSRTLTNASGLRVGQGSGQLNMKATTHGQGFTLFWGYPYKVAGRLAHGQVG
jgi:hypothetical protein